MNLKTTSLALAAASLLVSLPYLIAAVAQQTPAKQPQKVSVEIVQSRKAVYDSIADTKKKEEYLANIYEDLRHVDENKLPMDLCSFVIQVKVASFAKD